MFRNSLPSCRLIFPSFTERDTQFSMVRTSALSLKFT